MIVDANVEFVGISELSGWAGRRSRRTFSGIQESRVAVARPMARRWEETRLHGVGADPGSRFRRLCGRNRAADSVKSWLLHARTG
jgi:hypothetical protein